jgi:hypothetical protein
MKLEKACNQAAAEMSAHKTEASQFRSTIRSRFRYFIRG